MTKIIILIGLPASGKTTYFKSELTHLPSHAYADDYHGNSLDGTNSFDQGRCYSKLKEALKKGEGYAISDIEYCRQNILQDAEDGIHKLEKELGVKVEIERVYFQNNANACRHNVVQRYYESGEKTDYVDQLGKIDKLTKVYKPPAEALPIKTKCKLE